MKGIFYRRQALALAESGLEVTVVAIELISVLTLLKNPLRIFNLSRSMNQSGKLCEIRVVAALWRPGSESAVVKKHQHLLLRELQMLPHIDLLQAHVAWFAGVSTAAVALQLKLPYFITEHSSTVLVPKGFSAYRQDGLRRTYQGAHVNVAVSYFLKNAMEANFDAPRVEVIPNSVDGSFFHPADRQKAKKIIFSAGNLKPSKGFRELIAAFAQLDPIFELRIAGSGSAQFTSELQQLVHTLQLTERVIFTGQLSAEALRDAMQQALCFALPSYHETFGVVYIEALACGIPVLAGNVGGHTAFITPDRGVLVDAHDPASVAAGLQALIARLDSFDCTGLRAGILAEFGHTAVTQRMRDLIDHVLKGELLEGEHSR
jgi:glycosyltransferase involved in cell wall biosynthesis